MSHPHSNGERIPQGSPPGSPADLRRRKRETRAALRLLTRVMEEHTRRIAHELHDESSSLLAAVYLALDDLCRDLPPGPRERLLSIRMMLDQVQEGLRGISHELRPSVLDDFGLMPALEDLVRGVASRTGLTIILQGALRDRLPCEVETTLYRCVQEALANAAKHARATHVSVRVGRVGGNVFCSIRDDGSGFQDLAAAGRRLGGIGLVGIRARLSAHRGKLFIDSVQGSGTRLTALVPVERRHVAPDTRCG